MKKIFSALLTIMLLINIFSIGNIYANNEKIFHNKNIILAKAELNKSVKWKKYINTIDNFLGRLSENESKLKTVRNNIKKIDIESINNQETKYILIYMDSKIFSLLEEQKENEKEEIKTNKISQNQKEIFEEKVMNFQSNIYSSLENNMNNITKKYQELYNVSEKWNINVLAKFDHPALWNLDFNMGLNNYTASTYNLDSEFKWDFDLKAKWQMAWENIDLEVNTFIDLISKEGDIYFMLKDLWIVSEEKTEVIEEYTKKLSKLAEENKYVKYSDNQSQQEIDMIKSIDIDNILNDAESYLSEPMLEAYKVEWDKYYAKPTKFACDTAKKLAQKFDPFSPNKCSQSQYEDLLEDFSENMEVYFVFNWEETKVIFEWKNEDYKKNKLEIEFNKEELLELNYDFENESWEMNINIENDVLNINADFDQEYNIFDMDLEMNFSDNQISTFNVNVDYEAKKATMDPETWEIVYDDDFSDVFDMNLSFENNRISGETNFYYNDEKGVTIITSWNFGEKSLDMRNNFTFNEDFTKDIFMSKTDDFSWNFNVKYQENNESIIFNTDFKIAEWSSEILSFSIDSNYTSNENNSPIKTPENFINFEEIFWEMKN